MTRSLKNILGATALAIAFALIQGGPRIALSAEAQQSTPTAHTYTVREIKGMFRRPKSTEQLLRNLKLAYDHNLLAQPAFFQEDVLKQFFDGTAISWSNSGQVVELDDRIFPGMTIRVHHTEIPIAAGPHVPAHFESHNYIEVETGSTEVISVGQINDIFGDQFHEQLDLGEDPDGHSHIPTTKGSLQYSMEIRGPGTEDFNVRGALFVVTKDLAAPRCVPANQLRSHCGLKDDDVVELMSLSGSASVFPG
jgi:hypothetical protein